MINFELIKITPEMLNIISQIDEFKGQWLAIKNSSEAQLFSLQKAATIESIGSSNRIEGNKLSDKEVEKLLNNLNIQSFKSRDEQEVAGYSKLMKCIFDDYEVIPLNENYIKQLHQILLSYSDKDISHRGEYKKLANSVSAFDADGKEIGVIFETTSPFETPEKMRQLVKYAREAMDDNNIHPLILIGLFVVHFLAIHPFQDGNGRLSRALTALLLLKTGYTYVPYSSMETIIEGNKSGYYLALRETQQTLSQTPNYAPWLSFFFKLLQKQKQKLEKKIVSYKEEGVSLPLFASKILELFTEKNYWTTNEISEHLGAKTVTVKKTLAKLVDLKLIKKNGSTRGAWYERK